MSLSLSEPRRRNITSLQLSAQFIQFVPQAKLAAETKQEHFNLPASNSHDEVTTLTALRFCATATLALAISGLSATAQQFQNHLMPQPAKISIGSGSLALDSTFAVE